MKSKFIILPIIAMTCAAGLLFGGCSKKTMGGWSDNGVVRCYDNSFTLPFLVKSQCQLNAGQFWFKCDLTMEQMCEQIDEMVGTMAEMRTHEGKKAIKILVDYTTDVGWHVSYGYMIIEHSEYFELTNRIFVE
jgi:hypothetical protein